MSRHRGLVLFLLLATLTGCEGPLKRRLLREWNALVIVLTGHPSSLVEKPKRTAPGDTDAQAKKEGMYSVNAARAKANSEILGEMVRVVLGVGSIPPAEFGSLADSLNQGASFEGIYNGLVHSGRYRKFEIENPKTTSRAVSFFSDELVNTEAELNQATEFDGSSALPLRFIDPTNPGAADPRLQGIHDFSKPITFKGKGKNSVEQARSVQKLFSNSSVYTLKRVLGEETLKIIDEKKVDRIALAQWYSKWAVRMSARNVDFGISLRNNPDEKFHFDWAMKASLDQLQWEVLNRIHRVLNQAHGDKS